MILFYDSSILAVYNNESCYRKGVKKKKKKKKKKIESRETRGSAEYVVTDVSAKATWSNFRSGLLSGALLFERGYLT